jgi:hypothetical protein
MRKKRSLLLALALVLAAGYLFREYGFPNLSKVEEAQQKPVKAESKAKAAAPTYAAAQTLRPPKEPPVAMVRGRVRLNGDSGNSTTTITLFNGFEPEETVVQQGGTYSLPLRRSTEGTFISVFAAHDLFQPKVVSVRLSFKEFSAFDNFGRLPVITVPEILLEPSSRTDLGSILGVAYVRTVSGRPKLFEGILAFEPGESISITRPGEPGGAPAFETKVTADRDGNYFAQLPPGLYTILTSRNILIEGVQVERGRTTVVPVFSGEQQNF